MARYLVHSNNYGTLATHSRHLNGAPFANVVSVSDGAVGNSTGRLLFYLTPMDSTAYDLQVRAIVLACPCMACNLVSAAAISVAALAYHLDECRKTLRRPLRQAKRSCLARAAQWIQRCVALFTDLQGMLANGSPPRPRAHELHCIQPPRACPPHAM